MLNIANIVFQITKSPRNSYLKGNRRRENGVRLVQFGGRGLRSVGRSRSWFLGDRYAVGMYVFYRNFPVTRIGIVAAYVEDEFKFKWSLPTRP